MKKIKFHIVSITLAGACLGVGFHAQLMWYVKEPFMSPRAIVLAEIGAIFLWAAEFALLALRRRITGRPWRDLLASESLTSLPVSLAVLMLVESLMPLKYYYLIIWAISVGLTAVLKVVLILFDLARMGNSIEDDDTPISALLSRIRDVARRLRARNHVQVILLTVVMTILIQWPLMPWTMLLRGEFKAFFMARAIFSFEIWLVILYAASYAGRRIAGNIGAWAGPIVAAVLIAGFTFLPGLLKKLPTPWQWAESSSKVMMKPLFSDNSNILVRRVSLRSQLRDAVVTKVPSELIHDLPAGEHVLNMAFGVMCSPQSKGNISFIISVGDKVVRRDEADCQEQFWTNDWHYARAEGISGRVRVRVRVEPVGKTSGNIVGIISAHADARPAMNKPNVIVILIDTLRADHLGAYGYMRDTSPVMDGLASKGALFESASSQAPHTTPSTATILTGLYPNNHGISDIVETDFNPGVITLPERFRSAGYADAGFTATNIVEHFLKLGERFETFDWRCSRFMGSGSGGCLADRIIPWIEDNRDRPFFLYAHFFDPHDPYEAPEPYRTIYCSAGPDNPALKSGDMRGFTRGFLINFPLYKFTQKDNDYLKCLYDGEVRYSDVQIGRILDKLESLGILDNTIIVITADHGEEFMEHGRFLHGQNLYDDQTHVPLIIFKSRTIAPQRISRPAETADIAPTVLNLAGITFSGEMDGRNLAPFITGTDTAATLERVLSWTDHLTYRSVSIRSGDWKYIHTIPSWAGLPSEELYDLKSDPGETRNVIKDHPKLAKALDEESAKLLTRKKLPSLVKGLSPATRETLRSLGYIK